MTPSPETQHNTTPTHTHVSATHMRTQTCTHMRTQTCTHTHLPEMTDLGNKSDTKCRNNSAFVYANFGMCMCMCVCVCVCVCECVCVNASLQESVSEIRSSVTPP